MTRRENRSSGRRGSSARAHPQEEGQRNAGRGRKARPSPGAGREKGEHNVLDSSAARRNRAGVLPSHFFMVGQEEHGRAPRPNGMFT